MADSRSIFFKFRVTPEEKAEIEADAARAGCSGSEWARDRLLGRRGAHGTDDSGLPNPPGPSTEGDPADPEFAPAPEKKSRVAPRQPSPEPAPIARPESQEAFIGRRSTELFGQGKTSRLAVQIAKQEWEAR